MNPAPSKNSMILKMMARDWNMNKKEGAG